MFRFITHSSPYHCDETCGTAFLEIALDAECQEVDVSFKPSNIDPKNLKIPLVRVNKIDDIDVSDSGFVDIVYDVGYGKFDHHQKDKKIRSNGVPYAAFGLLWAEYAERYLGLDSEMVKMADEDFVQYIDRTDNFGQAKSPNPLATLVSANCQAEIPFLETVHMIKPMLKSLIDQYKKLSDQRAEVLSIIRDNPRGNSKRIFLGGDNHYDGRVFRGTEVKFVTGPSNRGPGVVLRSLDSEHFPIVDVEGITPSFIHTGRFTATYATEEDASKVAAESLKSAEKGENVTTSDAFTTLAYQKLNLKRID